MLLKVAHKLHNFLGVVQKLCNIFSSSLMRWKILQSHIGCSLHSLSHTRWSDRVESVKSFASHIPGIKSSLEALLQLNVIPETKADIQAILNTSSFLCILLMLLGALRILTPCPPLSGPACFQAIILLAVA